MEGLLIALLIGLITSFLNKKDGKKANETKPFMPQKQAPKETTQAHEQQKTARPTMKSLEDFTRDIMAQLQTKEQPAKEVAETVQQAVAEEVAHTRTPIETRVKERQQAMRDREEEPQTFTLPVTRQSLQQAIIMTEILGKPKAKQRS